MSLQPQLVEPVRLTLAVLDNVHGSTPCKRERSFEVCAPLRQHQGVVSRHAVELQVGHVGDCAGRNRPWISPEGALGQGPNVPPGRPVKRARTGLAHQAEGSARQSTLRKFAPSQDPEKQLGPARLREAA